MRSPFHIFPVRYGYSRKAQNQTTTNSKWPKCLTPDQRSEDFNQDKIPNRIKILFT